MEVQRVRVLINPKSGFGWSPDSIQAAIQQSWDRPDTDLTFQFSRNAEDGIEKTRRAVADGVQRILVVGGDGMVNSIGSALLGTGTALGVIPAGSGNGFARHFNIPQEPAAAAKKLAEAPVKRIDVGLVNGRPFFVTCSTAWDAALVKTFEKFPFRGPLPYILAGAYELLEYKPGPIDVELDGTPLHLDPPLVLTAANLTQYGNNAYVAPTADASDGLLEMVYLAKKDTHHLLANLHRLFDASIDQLPSVLTYTFRKMVLHRERPDPIQIDGELVEAPETVTIEVRPDALSVLVPEN